MINAYEIIKKYYTEGSPLYKILVQHSEHVKEKALEVAYRHPELQLDKTFIAEATMLHDIGIFMCDSPRIQCFGTRQYVEHGYLGAHIITLEGLPRHAMVCERHTGTGLSLETIVKRQLPLPHRDRIPVSLEEQVICYADKFFSKSKLATPHTLEHICEILNRHGEDESEKFFEWHKRFK